MIILIDGTLNCFTFLQDAYFGTVSSPHWLFTWMKEHFHPRRSYSWNIPTNRTTLKSLFIQLIRFSCDLSRGSYLLYILHAKHKLSYNPFPFTTKLVKWKEIATLKLSRNPESLQLGENLNRLPDAPPLWIVQKAHIEFND